MNSEFENLSDIVIGRGVKHSEIISLIEERVLQEFRLRYSKELKDIEIIINERIGSVRIFSYNADITPQDFGPVAEKIALQVLIQKLQETENKSSQLPQSASSGGISKWLTILLFWIYNGWYLLFISLASFNVLFNAEYRANVFEMIKNFGALKGIIFVLLIATPLVSLALAYGARRGKISLPLNKLFFIFEAPLVILFLAALFLFKNATPAIWFFFLMFAIIVVAVFVDSVKIKVNSLRNKWLMLIAKQSAFMTMGYLIILYSFFIPLAAAVFLSGITQSLQHFELFDIFLIGFSLIFYTIIAVFLASPYIFALRLFKTLRLAHKDFIGQIGTKQLYSSHAIIALVWLVSLFVLSYQPGTKYIEKLGNFKNIQSFDERQEAAKELISNKSNIEQEMKNISTARDRYLFSKNDDSIKKAYKSGLKFSEPMGNFIQGSFSTFAYPFVYQGIFDKTGSVFSNYEYLFGHRFEAGSFVYIQKDSVDLVSRNTRVQTNYQGLLSVITIEEEYKNTTFSNQEVVYEFSLPENSAIMDLKLGPNLEFNGVIAPKGAAGKVYQQELTKRRDPALLEQTGPRQYRLRVFPIPGKNDTTLGGKNQKVSFSYVTELTPQGYPLPIYTKEKNINKEVKTEKYYYLDNEKAVYDPESNFISRSSVLGNINLCNVFSSTVVAPPVDGVTAQLVPINSISEIAGAFECDKNKGISFVNSLKGSKFAILYDVSYDNSGNPFLDDISNFFNEHDEILKNNKIDFYLFNDLLSQKKQITGDWVKSPKDIIYFGKSDWVNQINKISAEYDFIIIAASSAEVSGVGENFKANGKAPLYIIHKDNKAPAYPDKVANYILQTGGKVANSFEDALNHYASSKQLKLKGLSNYIIDSLYSGTAIYVLPNQYSDIKESLKNFHLIMQPNDPLSYLPNKAYLYNLLSLYTGNLETETAVLDEFNNFAKTYHFVTPFSSLIALVNSEQMANLEKASQLQDRFTYEIPSSGGSATMSGFSPSNIPMGLSSSSTFSGFMLNSIVGDSAVGGSASSQSSLGIFLFILLNIAIIIIGSFVSLVVRFFRKKKE